jgi:hypothetical protein
MLIATSMPSASPSRTLSRIRPASADGYFGIKQYNEFHDVLHPLEHEALPSKDFARIRANAEKLVRRGRAIVSFGVPRRLAQKEKEEFGKELRKFCKALSLFDRVARSGDDNDLENSFSAVHDSFEMLVGMLPRK